MATIPQIRGALLEEAVLFLLRKVGYDTYDPHALLPHHQGHMRPGASGLEVRGRGTWHQLDAFALWRHSPAFMYPLQLMVEAKCYARHRPVGVEVPRNSVGVLKDISENYFTYPRRGGDIRGPRYNHTAAVFSASGFTKSAVEYAIAHQIFLIQYENVPAIEPVIDALFEFDESCINIRGSRAIAEARQFFRRCLTDDWPFGSPPALTRRGREVVCGRLAHACQSIQGSYFGMLQGQWPLHLLRTESLPEQAFTEDLVRCRLHGNREGGWKFVPVGWNLGHPAWFELEFSLPADIAELVKTNGRDAVAVANLKQQHFSYIDLTGIIGGIRRSIRLELDPEWIQRYVREQRAGE